MSCNLGCIRKCQHYHYPGYGPGVAIAGQKEKVKFVVNLLKLDLCPHQQEPFVSGSWIKVRFWANPENPGFDDLKKKVDAFKKQFPDLSDIACEYFADPPRNLAH
jgi:hypothetical protein